MLGAMGVEHAIEHLTDDHLFSGGSRGQVKGQEEGTDGTCSRNAWACLGVLWGLP